MRRTSPRVRVSTCFPSLFSLSSSTVVYVYNSLPPDSGVYNMWSALSIRSHWSFRICFWCYRVICSWHISNSLRFHHGFFRDGVTYRIFLYRLSLAWIFARRQPLCVASPSRLFSYGMRMIVIAFIIIIAVRTWFGYFRIRWATPLELLDRRVIYFRRGCK